MTSEVEISKDAFTDAVKLLAKASEALQQIAERFASEPTGASVTTAPSEAIKAIEKAAPSVSVAKSEADVEGEGPKPRRKREKKPTDPNAPKRPLPATLLYLNAEKKRIRDARASSGETPLPPAEVNELANSRWAEVSEEEKAKLQDEYNQRFMVYSAEMHAYKAKKEAEDPTNPPSTEPAAPSSPTPAKAASKKKSKSTKEQPKALIEDQPKEQLIEDAPPSSAPEATPKKDKKRKKDSSSPDKKKKKSKSSE